MNNLLPRTVVGIDVAGADLRVAILRSSIGKLRLINAFAVEGFEGLDVAARKAELVKMGERHQLKGSRIYLSVSEELGVARQLEFPVEVAGGLRSAVELQIENLSPWPVDEVYWDLAWKKPVRGEKKLRVTVAIATRDNLNQWTDLFASAGLPLTGVSVSTVSWGHAATRLWPGGAGTMLLHLQKGYAEGAFVRGEAIVSTRMTDDVPGRDRARHVATHLTSVGRVSAPDEIRVLTYGDDVDGLDTDNPLLPIEGTTAESNRSFGAIAAALGGLGRSSFSLNLVPEALRFRSNQLQLVPTYIGLGLVLLVVTASFVREPYQWSTYAAELDEAIATVASEAAAVTDQETELNALSDRYRALNVHLNGRDSTLEALDSLVGAIPPDTWVTSFSLSGSDVTIAGFSSGAAEVQRRVEESEVFENAEFTASVIRDNAGRDRFTLRFTIEDPS
jgi:Tfp pilus assembly protein PilN